jgi:hypothetical protein
LYSIVEFYPGSTGFGQRSTGSSYVERHLQRTEAEGRQPMMRTVQFGARRVAWVVVVVVAALSGAATAAATAPAAAVIPEATGFAGAHQPPAGTFTASGLPGCASGTFSDQLVSFNPSGTRPIVDRTYACAGGDTLTVRVALHLGTIDAEGTQTAEATWRIVSGTGALSELSGSGSASGLNSGCAPVGTAIGECAVGAATVIANVH